MSLQRRQLLALGAGLAGSGSVLAQTGARPKPAGQKVIGIALGGGSARGFAHIGVLQALGLPTRTTAPPVMARVLEAMLHDKKNRGGEVRLALPTRLGAMHPGEGNFTVPVTEELLAAAVSGLA